MLCHVMLCHVMLCYVTLRYGTLCDVMLCYVRLCYVLLCYIILCYVMHVWQFIALCHIMAPILCMILHTVSIQAWLCYRLQQWEAILFIFMKGSLVTII